VTQVFWQPCRVLNDFWSDRCRDVSRPSYSALRVQHLLRCSPSVDAQGPGDLDSLLRTALSRADHNQYSVRLAVASGKFTRQVRWSRHQKSIFSRITCLLGHSGKYSSVARRDSWWLSAVARRVGRVSERSLGGLVWSSPLRSVGNKAVVMGQTGLLADSAAVEASRTSPFQRACLLAAQAPHNGDWLLALPITACGLYD